VKSPDPSPAQPFIRDKQINQYVCPPMSARNTRG